MAIPDDQVDTLQLAVTAAHNWQDAAASVGVTIQQLVFEFPPNGQTNPVQFTWDSTAERFEIATLPGQPVPVVDSP